MNTTTKTITELDLTELKDLLRAPFAEEGLDIDSYGLRVEPGQLLQVASSFVLDGPTVGTFRDVLEDEHAFNSAHFYFHAHQICSILAMLAHLNRVPRTDYLVS